MNQKKLIANTGRLPLLKKDDRLIDGEVNGMILDNRGLEPPQPMMRTLAALEDLAENETLTIINDRRPMFLYEQLEEMGLKHRTEPQNDGSFKIEIFR